MFDIGWSELLVIVVVAIVVVGPRELPKMMGTFGHYAGKLRRAASDFQRQFNEAMRETEIAEVKQAMEAVRAETASLDRPVMLPKLDTSPAGPAHAPTQAAPAAAPAPVTPPIPAASTAPAVTDTGTKPKPARKRATSTKPKSGSAKRGKTPTEPPHDA
ncbi:MAG: Sec-independent protein translocase protein TatB [Methyloceanibacter sp.]